jgi:hypothetical protein
MDLLPYLIGILVVGSLKSHSVHQAYRGLSAKGTALRYYGTAAASQQPVARRVRDVPASTSSVRRSVWDPRGETGGGRRAGRIYHTSLAEYLPDAESSTDYRIDASVSQAFPTGIRGGGYRQVRFRRGDQASPQAPGLCRKRSDSATFCLYSAVNVRFSNCQMQASILPVTFFEHQRLLIASP